jgi:DNA-binding MarR family transcriptional regulator
MTTWLDEREMRAWRSYIETVGALTAALEADLATHHLTTGDYEVLVVLSETPGRKLRMCDLARQLRLSPSGLTRRLDGLTKAGYVRREPSESDRRAMLAVLTKEGSQAMRRAAPDHVASVRRHLLGHLTDRQIDQMGDIFSTVRAALLAEDPS